jgi:hypothetical protein
MQQKIRYINKQGTQCALFRINGTLKQCKQDIANISPLVDMRYGVSIVRGQKVATSSKRHLLQDEV